MSSVPITRKRVISYYHGKGTRIRYNKNTLVTIDTVTGDMAADGAQITVSEGHPFHHSWEGRDMGGDFFTSRMFVDGLSTRGAQPMPNFRLQTNPAYAGNTFIRYTGPVSPIPFTNGKLSVSQFPPEIASDDATLWVLGGTAIKRCKPGEPIVDLSTSLAELYREGIPAMIGHSAWKGKVSSARRKPVKGAASEYLNYVFGWSPLISDIRASAAGVSQWDKLVAQYERDAGKIVRRGYTFPDEKQETTTVLGTPNAALPFGAFNGAINDNMTSSLSPMGTLYRTSKITKKRWFKGAFTYALPDNYYSRNAIRKGAAEAEVLLGLELTPEVVWNLAPWSWAADWFANYGDVLSNLSDFGTFGLVMPYGYMMEHTHSEYLYQLKQHGISGLPDPLEMTTSRETKRRIKASPFGFGLTWDGLSPKQIAILASIGISR